MRLGKVKIQLEYIVDLDNHNMVSEAKNAIYEDLVLAFKFNELFDYIHATEEDKTLKKEDIPSFLTEETFIDDVS